MNKNSKGIRTITFIACVFVCLTGCAKEITYESIRAKLDELPIKADRIQVFTIVDVRSPEEWHAGSIQDAINIPYDTVLDAKRNLVNGGEAFTSIVTDPGKDVVIYGATAENSRTFARAVAFLGYEKVFYYPGGIADWRDHSDYLVLSYEGFRKWYDEFCPFDDGEHYLIDVNEVEDYTGNSTHIPGGGGHIPAATLIDNRTFVKIDGSNELKNGATAFTDALPDKNANIVIYCSGDYCPISEYAAEVAVFNLGYTNVYRFEGGWVEWEEQGNELAKGLDPGPCAEPENAKLKS